MNQTHEIQPRALIPGKVHGKWFNAPVSFYEGGLRDLYQFIPNIERQGFGLTQPDNRSSRINERLHTIVRLPFRQDDNHVPIGVVSKDYVLIRHHDVLDVVERALQSANISLGRVRAELRITEYGERMALSLYLPEKYQFDPGDGHPMALRLECFNSVDGSTRFRTLVGWFRFVCSNGLVIGVTRSDIRRRHVGDFCLDDVDGVLAAGLKDFEQEKENFKKWRNIKIPPDRIAKWVDQDLRQSLGFKAAARTYHIARFGSDAEVVGPYKGTTPTQIVMKETRPIPGTPPQCQNLFDLSQILAWLAKERRDLQEQLEWREKIPPVLEKLSPKKTKPA